MSGTGAVYRSALAALDQAGVAYVVQRGHATWPVVEGDLDLLVDPAQVDVAVDATRRGMAAAHAGPVVVCRHVDIPVVVALGPSQADLAEIDLADRTSWAVGGFLDLTRVLAGRRRSAVGLWEPAPGDASALLGVPALLGTAPVRSSKGAARLARVQELVVEDPVGAQAAWAEALGDRAAARALAAIAASDLGALGRITRTARPRRAARNLLRSPVTTLRRLAFVGWRRQRQAGCGLWQSHAARLEPLRAQPDDGHWVQRVEQVVANHPDTALGAAVLGPARIGQRRSKAGPISSGGKVSFPLESLVAGPRRRRYVCIVGPDGTGKSTLAARLTDALGAETLHRHWRPGGIPSLRRLAGRGESGVVTEPHAAEVHSAPKAALRTIYYACDFVIGHATVFWPVLRRGGFVILERGFEDMVVDPTRYSLPSGRLAAALLPLVPRPDATIVLQGDPALIHVRKPELPVAEIARQCELWRRRSARRSATLVLDVGATPEALTAAALAWLDQR